MLIRVSLSSAVPQSAMLNLKATDSFIVPFFANFLSALVLELRLYIAVYCHKMLDNDCNNGATMYTTYRLKANELNDDLLQSIKSLFHDQMIEIAVCDIDSASEDETQYLLKNPANRARLMQAIENIAQPDGVLELDLNQYEDHI